MVTLPKRGKLKDLMQSTEDAINAIPSGGGGGGNAWGSITGTLSSQTDLQTALDGKASASDLTSGLAGKADTSALTSGLSAKQDTLESGVNIKTVNGTSLLGSGDIPISGAVSWGGITGTLSAQSDLQSALNSKAPLSSPSFTGTVSLTGTDTGIELNGITNEPAAPSAGILRAYSKSIAGKMFLKIRGPSGLDTPIQNSFWQNGVTMWNPTNATAGSWIGTVGAGAGTFASPAVSSASAYTTIRRSRYSNVVTTLNQVLGQRNTQAMYFRGNSAGLGGFFFFARLGFATWTNGGRFFAGFATANTVVTGDPSALNNTVGFCVDAADNGAINFLTRGTSATKQPTGMTISNNNGFDCYIFCRPNDTNIYYRIVNINTGAEYSNVATANLPANTTFLTANVLASNAALTTANAIQLEVNKIYIETDY